MFCFFLIHAYSVTFFISPAQYVQNDSPSSKSLAGLVVQLLQFQEDAFGRRVNNPALTKLPVRNPFIFNQIIGWGCWILNTVLPFLGQMLPWFQGRRGSLSHPRVCLQVQERAGMVSWCSTFTSDVNPQSFSKLKPLFLCPTLSGVDLTCRILHGWTGTWRCSWMWRRTWSRYHLMSTIYLIVWIILHSFGWNYPLNKWDFLSF